MSIADKHAGRPVLDLELEGARVFSQETFDGNGRTCATCHPAANNFTLSPAFIATLPAHDPLFVAEFVPELASLEDPALMHGPRALILENIDGFDQPPVFRGTPHILNAALTAPYGLSGNVPTLGEFALGAIVQHAPKRLDRVPGIHFRLPTQEEIDAVEAFQRSVFAPPDRNFDLNALFTDRRLLQESLGEQPQHVEGADQIDLDHLGELGQRVDAVLADDPRRAADAGAIHQNARGAVGRLALGDRRLDVVLTGDVVMTERRAVTETLSRLGAQLVEHVADHHPGALRIW